MTMTDPRKIERLLVLTERLMKALNEDIAALERGRPREMRSHKPEVQQLAPGCRFADCRHMREPGCAVRAALESGALQPRRYESYRRLRRLREQLSAAHGPQRGR